MMESMIGCTCGVNSDACSIAARDKYEAMFLDNSLLPLCKNLTATGKARCITDFLL
jgi:hypothetical protein